MKKTILMMLACSLFFSCKKVIVQESAKEDLSVMSRAEIDHNIKLIFSEKKYYSWSFAEPKMIWSALEQSDHILSVGYKKDDDSVTTSPFQFTDIHQPEWEEVKSYLIDMVLKFEKKKNPCLTVDSIIPWKEEVLPVLDIVVRNRETLNWLISDRHIRYAEPMGYEPEWESGITKKRNDCYKVSSGGSGCDGNTPVSGLMVNMDYHMIAPYTKQSWNYAFHRIPQAWQKSTGAGAKVFLIDTGCEYDQENLGSAFNQGASVGRTRDFLVTLPRASILGIPTGPVETADDGCGHGTSMAGVCAAPRGIDGNACGVAYNCNLITCRAAEDVYLDDSREVKGVSDAFTLAANREDVKIISMSMGKIISSSQLKDAVLYAYGKNKLIFCAAGTSFSWTSGWWGVIFPASLPQVNAITGVLSNNFNESCNDCHDGSETDFTIVMERQTDGRHPLTLAMSGDIPSTVGGSSVATATAAGIAALVWSRYPGFTRDQVLNKLIQTSANYPYRSSTLGWGNLNADAATN